ncbi:hypothetical protein ACFOLM_23430 [Deinococcus soli (ex Cha et al. 2016)]|uniref:hypothetical protein n=1 Tax=Deinococcus soli (ex Cha et al. 2016) TaxID=1309411 RepID=UPI00360F6A3E
MGAGCTWSSPPRGNDVVDAAKAPKDAAMTALSRRQGLTDPISRTVIATLGVEQITRAAAPNGESLLGRVIADCQLAAAAARQQGRRRDRLHEPRRHPAPTCP